MVAYDKITGFVDFGKYLEQIAKNRWKIQGEWGSHEDFIRNRPMLWAYKVLNNIYESYRTMHLTFIYIKKSPFEGFFVYGTTRRNPRTLLPDQNIGNSTKVSDQFLISNFSIPTLESGSFGAINRLTDFIESPISSEGIREIIEGDKIYHALTHPKTVRAFLDAYKNLNWKLI